jgi:hypothetical protein
MASITVTTSCYWGGAEYSWSGLAWGDRVTVSSGAVLTIDPSVTTPTNIDLGVELYTTSGFSEIKFVNTSTTTPLIHYGPYGSSYKLTCQNQCHLTIEGDYIQLGTGDGTVDQVLSTEWTSAGFDAADEPAALVTELSGVYTTWLNVSSYDLDDFGVGEMGYWFSYNNSTGAITFGDGGDTTAGQGGAVVPNGAKILAYNIGIGCKNSSAVRQITSTIADDYTPAFVGGNVNISKCYFFGTNPYFATCNLTVDHLATIHGINLYNTSDASLSNVSVSHDRYIAASSSMTVFKFTTSAFGATLTNCKFAMGSGGSSEYAVTLASGNSDITFDGCEFWMFDRLSSGNRYALYLYQVSNVELTDCKFIGAGVRAIGDNITMTDIGYSGSINSSLYTTNPKPLCLGDNVSNITMDGWYKLDSGAACYGSTFVTGVRYIKNSDIYVDTTTYGIQVAISVETKIINTFISGATTSPLYVVQVSNTATIQDIRAGSFTGTLFYSYSCPRNSVFKSVDTGASPLPADVGYFGANTNFYTVNTGTTTGLMGILMNQKTSENTNYVLDGDAIFYNGRLYLLNSGDNIIFTWSHRVFGVTAFPSGGTYTISGSGTSNYTVEYDIDTGSGYSGSWTALSMANLSGESITASTGFLFKVKITATATSSSNYISRLDWSTTVDRTNYLYPEDYVTVTLQNVADGSSYWVYNDTDGSLVGSGTQSGTADIDIENVAYSGTSETLTVRVRKSSASPKYKNFQTNATLTANGANVYVSQVPDTIAS